MYYVTSIVNFCAAAAPRQWRSPRRGARRVGEPTPLQLNIKLMICNYTPAPHIPEVFCDKNIFLKGIFYLN